MHTSKNSNLCSSKAFASLLGLLIAILLCLLLYWVLLKPGPAKDPSVARIEREFKENQLPVPVDTSSAISTYHSVLEKVKSIEAQNIQRGDGLMKEIEDLNQEAYSGQQ
ncbi:MAG TPA: hypothetical protein P5160_09625 [Candidatus Omnitrophota bacterium]|nr:hypothetical protein [Candidatus Omnitrophota bacterium]